MEASEGHPFLRPGRLNKRPSVGPRSFFQGFREN